MYPLYHRPNADAIAYNFLRRSGKHVPFDSLSTDLGIHPDYPSLLSINEVLENFGIVNNSYVVPTEDLHEVPVPFIAHTKKIGQEYFLVTKVTNTHVYYSDGRSKQKKIEIAEFGKLYNNIVLSRKDAEEPSKAFDSGLFAFLSPNRFPITGLIFLLLLIVSLKVNSNFFEKINLSLYAIISSSILGTFISVLLLIQSLNGSNPLIQKLCGGKKSNCKSILDSTAAKVFSWLSWSEVGFFYFAGMFLAVLFGFNQPDFLRFLSCITCLTLPYTFYSIYYQARIAKQWCVLCCITQGLLWLEFVSFFRYLKAPFDQIGIGQLANLMVAFSLPVLLWILLKPIVQRLQKVDPLQAQLRKFKFSNDLFQAQLNKQPKYALPADTWSITLGSKDAANCITIVSNLYCDPCARAHSILDDWLTKKGDLQVKIVFTSNNDDSNRQYTVARHLLALNELADKRIVATALHDWFGQKIKDYEKWAAKYPVDISEDISLKIDSQFNWCKMIGVSVTPTFLINGNKMPGGYQIQDLKYLLN